MINFDPCTDILARIHINKKVETQTCRAQQMNVARNTQTSKHKADPWRTDRANAQTGISTNTEDKNVQ